MSRHFHKNLQRGIEQPLHMKQLPPRRSRHGRVMVGEAPRGFADDRPSPFVKRWRTIHEVPGMILLEVQHHSRLMTADEVQDARKMMVAANPTATYGQENSGGESAGRKSAKKLDSRSNR
jgi:hypothetical protein